MLFKNPRELLSESAAADLLNPDVSEEVKDVVEELEDVLTNNIEEVKEKDKTTNGGIPVTTQGAPVMEAACTYGRAGKYLVTIESVIAICENEEAAAAEAAPEEEPMEEPGQAPAEVPEADPVNVIEKIASDNGVEPEQVKVVISSESAKYFSEMAILESKCGKADCNNKSLGLARKYAYTAARLAEAGYLVKV